MPTMHARKIHHSHSSSSRAGFTIMEIAVALVVLSVGIGGLVAASISSYQLSRSNEARSIALDGARQVVERIRAVDVTDAFATYNETPEDDPGGKGTASGAGFSVEGLTPLDDDADGMVGSVVFPTDEAGNLREDLEDKALGMPRDLNLDGVIDSGDHSDDYLLLPVGVRMDWKSAKGLGHYQVEILLMGTR